MIDPVIRHPNPIATIVKSRTCDSMKPRFSNKYRTHRLHPRGAAYYLDSLKPSHASRPDYRLSGSDLIPVNSRAISGLTDQSEPCQQVSEVRAAVGKSEMPTMGDGPRRKLRYEDITIVGMAGTTKSRQAGYAAQGETDCLLTTTIPESVT